MGLHFHLHSKCDSDLCGHCTDVKTEALENENLSQLVETGRLLMVVSLPALCSWRRVRERSRPWRAAPKLLERAKGKRQSPKGQARARGGTGSSTGRDDIFYGRYHRRWVAEQRPTGHITWGASPRSLNEKILKSHNQTSLKLIWKVRGNNHLACPLPLV